MDVEKATGNEHLSTAVSIARTHRRRLAGVLGLVKVHPVTQTSFRRDVDVEMPAMLDDPDAPTIYRVSGEPPFPDPAHPSIPPSIVPRRVTLRDRQTVATIVPFASRHQVPGSLVHYLGDQFNKEIEGGDTYPMMEGLAPSKFASYWFQNFGAIMLLGDVAHADDVLEGRDWAKECLGTFYIKPNYPGRSSHVCNAGFMVTDASRNRGVGRLMGEAYLDWAPRLGYTYSVFNLVYETNVASCRIWDALGFKRIGRVKGCGRLKSYPDQAIDAIIYGRELGLDDNGGGGGDELVSEERFDKIKFYLKYGRYPNGADRAEKSRLRSAATHYKLLEGDVLMLKGKEVIADPPRQIQIARRVHGAHAHAGINKTTATIAEKYHWSRIKETVSDVIRSCPECKELGKAASLSQAASSSGANGVAKRTAVGAPAAPKASPKASSKASSKRSSPGPSTIYTSRPGARPETPLSPFAVPSHTYADTDVDADGISGIAPSHTLQSLPHSLLSHLQPYESRHTGHHDTDQPHAVPVPLPHSPITAESLYEPIDPQIISQPPSHVHHSPLHRQPHYTFQSSPRPPRDPRVNPFHAMALLSSAAANVGPALTHPDAEDSDSVDDARRHHHRHGGHARGVLVDDDDDDDAAAEQAAVERDLEMLIDSQEDDDDDGVVMDVDVDLPTVGGMARPPGSEKMDVSHLLAVDSDCERAEVRGKTRGVYDEAFDVTGLGG